MSNWIWRNFKEWLLDRWQAKPLEHDHPICTRLRHLAWELRLPPPELYLTKEYSPNIAFLFWGRARPCFVLTEGLVQILNAQEMDAVLCHGLSQSRISSCRLSLIPSLILVPWSGVLSYLPFIFQYFLRIWPLSIVRFFLSPKRFGRADITASKDGRGLALVSALQKSSVLARKIPLRNAHWAWNQVFLISPEEQNFPLVVRTHPPLESRLKTLIDRST